MTNNTTAPDLINRLNIYMGEFGDSADECISEAADALEAAQARIAELEEAAVSIRSQAIRDFCEAAGIKASVQVNHLPNDVRLFRAQAAFDQKTARAALQEGKG